MFSLYSFDGLAWASAQLCCYLKTSFQSKKHVFRESKGAVQSPEEVIFTSAHKILFCDLELGNDQGKTCKRL